MRILVVHHRYRVRGGEDQAVDREVSLLREGGLEVELWERDSREIAGLFARAHAALEIPYSEQSRDELASKLAAYQPSLVHVHNWFPTFTPSIYDACISKKIPIVQTLHNYRIFCASGLLARDGKPCELCLGGNTLPALRYACYQDSRASTYALTRMIQFHRRQNTWNTKVDAFIALSDFSAGKLAEGGVDRATLHPRRAVDQVRVRAGEIGPEVLVEGQAPQPVAGVAAEGKQLLDEKLIRAEERRIERAQRAMRGAGQGRDIHEVRGAQPLHPGHRIAEDEPTFGVRVGDLDPLAVERGDDVRRAGGTRADRVLDGGGHDEQRQIGRAHV